MRSRGLSDSEIAAALGTSNVAIRTLVYRARNQGMLIPLTNYAPARGRPLKVRA